MPLLGRLTNVARRSAGLTGVFLVATSAPLLHAQALPCGISKVISWQASSYPPIARAAHVVGPAIFLVKFDSSGKTSKASVVAGAAMLRKVSVDSVQAMQVNSFEGVRECPIVILYQVGNCDTAQPASPLPLMRVCAEPLVLSTEYSVATTAGSKAKF